MKKVIALNENEIRVLTTRVTAEKKDWWITHNLEVDILPKNLLSCNTSLEPETGNIFESNNRFYRITKSEKILICTICQQKANFKIGYRFYCKKHYKHLMLTKPIRRAIINPERNAPCPCGSGQKFKNCCLSKSDHKPRHYFNSLFMEDPKIVKSLNTIVH
jgi:hypothetical protein